jgi:flagellar motor switch protein FliM
MTAKSTSSMLLARAPAAKAEQPLLPSVEEFFRLIGFKLRARLVNRCGANFVVALAGIESRSLVEVKNDPDFVESGVYAVLRFDKPRLAAVVVLERELLVRVIGAMLGDDKPDDRGDEDAAARALSPVQVRIAARLVKDMVQDLSQSWPGGPAPVVEADGAPGPARVISVEHGNEDLTVADFLVSTAEGPYGRVLVTVPTSLLRGASAGRGPTKPVRKPPEIARVMPVEVDVVGEMARLSMRVRDLRQLQVGDLIPLGRLDTATLRVNGKSVFLGEPGHANGQRCVRIKKRAE